MTKQRRDHLMHYGAIYVALLAYMIAHLLHAFFSWRLHVLESKGIDSWTTEFWKDTFENWQSEFLQGAFGAFLFSVGWWVRRTFLASKED